MNLTNLFKIAFKALSNNKLRGFLTMLGIIIGVGSVITMLAIGQGSKRSIQAQISEMGSNMIMIHPGGDRRGGVRLDAADMESLKLKDLEDIQAQARYISYISPSVNSSEKNTQYHPIQIQRRNHRFHLQKPQKNKTVQISPKLTQNYHKLKTTI
jgi:putative ABC transport system permease protein